MKLLIDIGNSTIVVATITKNDEIGKTWRFKTVKEETVKFFRHELWAGFKKHNMLVTEIDEVVISSVVPEVNDDVAQAISDLTGVIPHFFCIDDALRCIKVDVESPSQLGKDRVADAIGALELYGAPAIVFDFGTATTVGIINGKETFVGGMIIPGVKTSLNALSSRASQLPVIDIEKPRNMIGRNTLECMQSGILYGTAAMIDGLIDRLLPLIGTNDNVKLIATGGMMKYITPYCQHKIIVEEFLQFKGILHATKQKKYSLHVV
ncbi:MAG: type III pantothenate kinase [Prevotella sp.]|nr:type III pantothenate kinase [Prevotella sp.]MBQ9561244.1 type III pantothenate kinase [Prevotella sp.]MBR1840205.1 type III pantothenate kinase [Prevotella sp.]